MTNPLLSNFPTPFEVAPFSEIEPAHFMPAIHAAIDQARAEIDAICTNTEVPDFDNTIKALERSGEKLSKVTPVLFNLNAAETSEALQKVAQEASPVLTSFDAEIKQNQVLFERIRAVYQLGLGEEHDAEDHMLLDKTYKSFVRSGADLDDEGKARFKDISVELSRLGLQFGEHVLDETNSFELVIDQEKDLSGLPDDVISRAAQLAEDRDKAGQWIFTLQAPSYIPFMEYAENRSLREKMYCAYMTKAFKNNDRDNQQLVRDIVRLRKEKAQLLGFKTYAAFVLEERMAQHPDQVEAFLEDLLARALPKAKAEVAEVKAFMEEMGVDHDLERWDWSYYSEKLRKKKFELDDELTRPYFKLENVIDGVFTTAARLYGLNFVRNETIPVYHSDVIAFEVRDDRDEMVAVFFADFFPRKGKRPGAWMTSYRDQRTENGRRVIPQISIVCNFTPSSEENPSLLKFDEVKTLFHEFGHALHGMLANTNYASLSGTSVYWDFVELPSQIFENWCYEKECLDLFARHYKTGEAIPGDYVRRLIASANFHEAYATVRQLSFGLLDMAYHNDPSLDAEHLDVAAFERQVLSSIELFPVVDGTNMSVQFAHIFAGGYASGYYSYKWAEVLDADAFALFKQHGVFDRETATSFKTHVLSKGGTRHPMDLYKAFRGKEPTPEALLRRAGLLQE